MKTLLLRVLTLVALCLLGTIVWAGQKPNAVESGALTIRVVSDSLHGEYHNRGRTIYFETMRGEDTPKDVRASDPDAPKHEIDVRFMDGGRRPLISGSGGHDYILHEWSDDLQGLNDIWIDPVDRAKDFILVREVGKIIERRFHDGRIAAHFVDEVRIVVNNTILDDSELFDSSDLNEKTNGTTYRHKAHIQRKPAFEVTWYDHSAIKVNVYYSDGALYGIFYTSNHGAAATDPSMSTKCYLNYSGRSNPVPYYSNSCESYGSEYWTHVCNNDTLIQWMNVQTNSYWLPVSAQCWGPYLLYAPNCACYL